VKSKKPIRPAPRPRRRSPDVVDEASFTVVLEDLRAKFDAFGEALWSVRDELRSEMHGIRDELRSEMHGMRDELRSEMHDMRAELRGEMSEMRTDISLLKTAVLDLSKRIP
jgi:hypothetical protein